MEDVDTIALDRFRLRDQVETLIEAHLTREREETFKNWLLRNRAVKGAVFS